MIMQGDVIKALRKLPADSVDCVITSTPYLGLRDYKIPPSIWDEPDTPCEHEWSSEMVRTLRGDTGVEDRKRRARPMKLRQGQFCVKCKAWKGTLGSEPDHNLFVKHIVDVMREVRRVLSPTGCLWLNIGDTYAGSGGAGGDYLPGGRREGQPTWRAEKFALPSKCLMGIPWRIYVAMLDDGWIGRNTIPWIKPNGMPSSVPDRFSNKWEPVFFFVKNNRPKYWVNIKTRLMVSKEPAGTKGAEWEDWIWRVKEDNGGPRSPRVVYYEEDGKKLRKEKVSLWESHDYWFDLDAVRIPHKFPEAVRRRIMQDAQDKINPFIKGNETRGEWRRDLQESTHRRKPTARLSGEGLPPQPEVDPGRAFHEAGANPRDTFVDEVVSSWGTDGKGEYHGEGQKDYAGAGVQNPSDVKRSIIRSFKDDPKGKSPGDVFEKGEGDWKWQGIDQEGQSKHQMARDGHSGYFNKDGDLLVNPAGGNPGDFEKDEQEFAALLQAIKKGEVKVEELPETVLRAFLAHAASRLEDEQPPDIWEIVTQPFKGAHFATFPEKLVERAMKVSCPAEICIRCGLPRERIRETKYQILAKGTKGDDPKVKVGMADGVNKFGSMPYRRANAIHSTVGWSHCACVDPAYRPGVSLDPFAGSGTVGKKAQDLERSSVLIEIKPEYIAMAKSKRMKWGAENIDAGVEWMEVKVE